MPYHEALERADSDSSIDPADYVAFAPAEGWAQFSYASEHVSNDVAIGALMSCLRVLERARGSFTSVTDAQIAWINARLAELWALRGPCPGLGSALTAFGVENGTLVAYELSGLLRENEDPWALLERAFEDPHSVKRGLQSSLTRSLRELWRSLKPERRALLKLLSRFDITPVQATRFYEQSERGKAGIEAAEPELLANPYLLYELDRYSTDPISVTAIDRGAFPDPLVREAHPLPQPSAMDDPLDRRRVRAFSVDRLEGSADRGDTLRRLDDLVVDIRELPLDPALPVGRDLLELYLPDLSPPIIEARLKDGELALQLDYLHDAGERIRRAVEKRLAGKQHEVTVDWPGILEGILPAVGSEDEAESHAREEKAAALAVLARSRLSVLLGSAGTGKTTLLEALCSISEIADSGVLLLAPTGKARVQLARRIDAPAQTIAQFLLGSGRYDPETGRYMPSSQPRTDSYATVIVDESSMLTEEQLSAVVDALGGVHRLILVGDPRQLPPIGSGRPFADIVRRLRPADIEGRFPRCDGAYAELTVPRRPTGTRGTRGVQRSDLLLAEWFRGEAPGAGSDEIWEQIRSGSTDGTLEVVEWSDEKDLEAKLLSLLQSELKMDGLKDSLGFERALGGTEINGNSYFRRGGAVGEAGASRAAEAWQILSPVRNQGHGVRGLNRFLQRRFRAGTIDWSRSKYRKIPRPAGPEEIVYGDKVINLENNGRIRCWPKDGALGYVANGEIGIVVGEYKHKNMTWMPKTLEVELASQPGVAYKYPRGRMSGESGSPPLELAYAITVHKAQGSEFEASFLVIPNPCRLLSRELLYTALTRQRERVVVLYQGDASDLKDLADPRRSVTATRLTNLFEAPKLVKLEDRFLEEGLIHRTQRGDAVRSKSEVIVADLFYSKGLDYAYERRLIAADGSVRYPDFTIEDAESGLTVYWEHLGMLSNPDYRRRWERKVAWYRAQGIMPEAEGTGSVGQLVVSEDDPQGGIDTQTLATRVSEIFGV